uniref:MTBC n=1 Tax=Arundo donax TaxID=35708 RepID=A0A0A9H2X1_ARUDO
MPLACHFGALEAHPRTPLL